MNKDQNDNVQYTAADISRYLQGEMTAAEMYALEKAALEDPFLADAIEGYGERYNAGETNFRSHFDDLHHRLQKRIQEDDKKVVAIYNQKWWRIAAVLLLLAGSGALVYTLLNNYTETSKLSVAKNESNAIQDTSTGKVLLEEPLTKADSTSIALNDSSPGNDQKAFSLSKARPRSSAPTLLRQAAPSTSDAARDEESDRSKGKKFEESIAAVPSKREMLAKTAPEESPKVMRVESKEVSAGYFSGRVTSEDNKPVPGASVAIAGKKQGVATDSNGNFNFLLPDTVATVAVNAVGFETASTTIRSGISNNSIKLTESDGALGEVVVVGYGTQKKSNVLLGKVAGIDVGAEPEIGFLEYNKYIQKNKRIDSQESSPHGNVVVSFLVNKKGTPGDFNIEKSLSKSMDEEAIRLLKEGPAWKRLKNKKTRVVFTIEF